MRPESEKLINLVKFARHATHRGSVREAHAAERAILCTGNARGRESDVFKDKLLSRFTDFLFSLVVFQDQVHSHQIEHGDCRHRGVVDVLMGW